MNNPPQILLIAPDKQERQILVFELNKTYKVVCFDAISEALVFTQQEQTSVILLDVDEYGFDDSNLFKDNHTIKDIPLIFLSSETDVILKQMAFDCGGIDCIEKTAPFTELLLKVKSSVATHLEIRRLRQRVHEAESLAKTVIQSSGEIGMAMEIIEDMYLCSSQDELMDTLTQGLNKYGLNSIILIEKSNTPLLFSDQLQISPPEKNVIQLLHLENKRFTDFGARTHVCIPPLSLLIKNMPINDSDQYGRLKDIFPRLMYAAINQLQVISTEQAFADQAHQLCLAFEEVQSSLDETGQALTQSQQRLIQLLRELLAEIEVKIATLGLDDDQEKFFLAKLDYALGSAYKIVDDSEKAKITFSTISRLLCHLVSQQNKILMDLKLKRIENHVAEHKAQESGEVDLF